VNFGTRLGMVPNSAAGEGAGASLAARLAGVLPPPTAVDLGRSHALLSHQAGGVLASSLIEFADPAFHAELERASGRLV
jgi:hypothetical protein